MVVYLLQVETLIQALTSEEGIKKIPQARIIDLLDAIEKNVKQREVITGFQFVTFVTLAHARVVQSDKFQSGIFGIFYSFETK